MVVTALLGQSLGGISRLGGVRSIRSRPVTTPAKRGRPQLPTLPQRLFVGDGVVGSGKGPEDSVRGRFECSAGSDGGSPSAFKTFSELYANLFPLWLAIGGIAAALRPATFTWMTTNYFTAGLALLMFSMGITLTVDDFKRCATKPAPVAVNFLACYGVMPLLGFVIGKVMGFSDAFVAGLVLVGATNGGQASNLCTYIARGDVALSVLMTTSTTLGCIAMTPLICKLAVGAVVPIDAVGMALSTIQVVLLPIVLGLTLNTFAPKFCRKVEPFCPVVGVTSTIALVGGSIAPCAATVLESGLPLHIGCALLHIAGGLLGYLGCKVCGFGERTARTTAIETSMKSSAFSFLLASLHFGDFMVRVPAAVSVVWMAIIGSMLAVFWRGIPVDDEATAAA
ncbi:hypothetical protein BSKO_05239 [Bryopsis sp. KO-2023]|nr:hypothetical protein BSKO_05239 [Bryopsis sp. KO-2023]